MLFKDKKDYIEYLGLFFIGVILTFLITGNLPGIQTQVGRFFKLLMPFYIGFAIAYILNRPIGYFQKRFKLKRGPIIAATYLGLIFMIAMFVSYLLPQIIQNSVSLVTEITKWITTQDYNLDHYNLGPFEKVVTDNMTKMADILSLVSNFIIENVSKLFGGIASALMQTIMGLIISIYMLADKDKFVNLAKIVNNAIFSKHRAEKISKFAKNVNEIFSRFITGLIVEALIIGVLAFIGLTIMGIKYAPILAVIICFTNIIPYVGPFIGAVPAIIATLTYDPMKAIWVAVFIVVLQQVDGNFIGPKIMGNFIGLGPIWIILSITIGGGYAGLLGMVLAVPIAAILKIGFTELLEKQIQKKASSGGDIKV